MEMEKKLSVFPSSARDVSRLKVWWVLPLLPGTQTDLPKDKELCQFVIEIYMRHNDYI